ncbi:MAG TPA: PfkB family carbohydrate kinase, partial [Arenibaculum sp.]|nr:PfkB family carbohydrate kinase [Arenibaculum sp.]
RETARAAYGEVLRRTDIAFPGQGDERDLFGDDTPHAILDRLGEAGVAEIVVKLDRPGCMISTGGALTCAFAEPAAKVVDTTAAGDSFSAGYLAARLRGRDPAEAARAGQHLAAAVIGHHGAIIPRSAMPMALRRFA